MSFRTLFILLFICPVILPAQVRHYVFDSVQMPHSPTKKRHTGAWWGVGMQCVVPSVKGEMTLNNSSIGGGISTEPIDESGLNWGVEVMRNASILKNESASQLINTTSGNFTAGPMGSNIGLTLRLGSYLMYGYGYGTGYNLDKNIGFGLGAGLETGFMMVPGSENHPTYKGNWYYAGFANHKTFYLLPAVRAHFLFSPGLGITFSSTLLSKTDKKGDKNNLPHLISTTEYWRNFSITICFFDNGW